MSKENPEVDVVNCDEQVERVDLDFKKVDPNDDTEYSSSFGGTCSGSEDELKNDSSDMEVDSNGPSMFFGDSNRIFRYFFSDSFCSLLYPSYIYIYS